MPSSSPRDDGFELSQVHADKGVITESEIRGDRSDNQTLARLGKKPVLKRNFGFMSILGFSCTALITWEGSLILFVAGLGNGGPAGIVYGFILVWLGTLSVFVTLSELASMAPTSGGQYHWTAMLAPSSIQKFLSYVTGWFTVSGWIAAVASGVYLTGGLLQGLVVHTNMSYMPESWHTFLISWAVMAFCVLINTALSRYLPHFEGLILVLHILGFFAILIPLVVLAPRGTAESVFDTWFNEGMWPTQSLSFFVGLLGNLFAFIGADGAIHMSEEIRNAELVVPRSIIATILINGSLGFGMILATLFCLGDLTAALETPTGFPFIQIFYQATNSVSGSAAMVSLIFVLAVCATVALLASCSRTMWAFSRDKALPFSNWISSVNARTLVPINSVLVITVIVCLLQLITIGSTTAFNNIVSLSISGLFTSYLIAATLLLIRRVTGAIKTQAEAGDAELINTLNAPLVWGPWRIPGILGIANNVIACAYLAIVLIFVYFPPATPVDASSMNYCIVVTSGVTIFAILYYLLRARKIYQGPVVEI